MTALANTLAAVVLLASAGASARADCPSTGTETAKIAAVEPRLELRLADGRLLRLVGLDAASATATDPDLMERTRSRLASLIADRPLSLLLLDRRPDRWGRLPAFAFAVEGAGGIAIQALTAGLARYNPEPAAHGCRDTFLAAEIQARTTSVGLWRDRHYGVLAVDDTSAFEQRSATIVLVQGRLTAVDAGPYRTKLRFAKRDRNDRDTLVATILPHTMKLFETQGVTFSLLIGREMRLRGLLDLRFGPEVELTGPDAVEVLPVSDAPASAPALAGRG